MSIVRRFPPEGFAGAVPPGDAPESYLRRFAEAQLRRLAAGETTAADCVSRVDAVAAAFEGTGILEGEQAGAVADDLDVALAARSPERGTLLHAGRRTQISVLRGTAGFARIFARKAQMRARGIGEGGGDPEDPAEDVSVIPAGAVLRLRDDADEDIYLLSYVTTPGRAWLSVAARTAEPRLPRRHASPPSTRSAGPLRGRTASSGGNDPPQTPPAHGGAARPPIPPAGGLLAPHTSSGRTRKRDTFAAGGLTAVDDAGRKYDLYFSGGGGHWYLGRLSVSPAPPPGIAWLEVGCAGQSVRLDLTAKSPSADVTVRPVAGSTGEVYLLRRAEALLGHAADGTASLARLAAAEMTGLASAVPALRAVGVLPDDSPVPGQLAALAERMGAPGPGRLIAEPGRLPERWASVLDAGGPDALRPADLGRADATGTADEADAMAAAHLTVVLPEADGLAVHLAGMVTLPDEGTLIFGGLRAWSTDGGQSLWLRDDNGAWHAVSISGWSSNGSSHTFQAAVVPPVSPDVSHVEFYVTGATTQVRAVIPLTWWTS